MPCMSSQYMVLIRYSCWMLRTWRGRGGWGEEKSRQGQTRAEEAEGRGGGGYRAQVVGDLIEGLLRLLVNDLRDWTRTRDEWASILRLNRKACGREGMVPEIQLPV